jgi:5-methylcytosine-specific restriction endonuclease McrA
MPIRSENRKRYPADWPAIRARILARADHRCERCGVKNHTLGGRLPSGVFCAAMPTGDNGLRNTWPKPGEHAACWIAATGKPRTMRIVRIVLTIAHLDHTPENCDPANLQALCQQCHNRLDAKMRAAGLKARRRSAAAANDLFQE